MTFQFRNVKIEVISRVKVGMSAFTLCSPLVGEFKYLVFVLQQDSRK